MYNDIVMEIYQNDIGTYTLICFQNSEHIPFTIHILLLSIVRDENTFILDMEHEGTTEEHLQKRETYLIESYDHSSIKCRYVNEAKFKCVSPCSN